MAHLVVPTPHAKGKIERRFRTFQGRLVTVMAHAGVTGAERPGEALTMEIDRLNRIRSRTTCSLLQELSERQGLDGTGRMRPHPCPSLLDLRLSLRCSRRVNHNHNKDFEGRSCAIADTPSSYACVCPLIFEHMPNKWPSP